MSEELQWSVRLEELLDRHHVRSTIVLGIASWMTIELQNWSYQFAATSTRSGVEIAAILAAVGIPATAYAGFAFKWWLENK